MTAGTNPVAEATTGSTFNDIKGSIVNAANWLGRQVMTMATSIRDFAVKIVEWAKPFFSTIAKFIGETYDKAREYLVANKEFALPAAIATLVGGVVILASYFICSTDTPKEGEKTAAPAKA